jgi:hypothetical protein
MEDGGLRLEEEDGGWRLEMEGGGRGRRLPWDGGIFGVGPADRIV